MNRRSILAAYKKKSSHFQTGVTGFKSGNLFKFVRYSAVLLGLVVLCTKTRNRFCPMCTKECCIVLTRPNPFWGQFWGQIGEINSYPHRLNKCAALVSLQNWDTDITGFTHRKSPTNRYISFTLRQEVVRKYHATTAPQTAPVAARNAPIWTHPQCIGVVLVQPNIAPKSPLSGDFLFYHKGFYLDWISLYR
jgi:hypothetical protein